MNYLIWGATVILYIPVFRQLYRMRWKNIDYTHAYFILPVALWLIWRSRKQLIAVIQPPSRKASTAGLASIIIGILMFIFSWRQDYLSLQALSLIPVLSGLCAYLYGTKFFKTAAFPIFYLLLLVPPPLGVLDSITLPMRYGVSILTQKLLTMAHYPITREGLLLVIGGKEIYMGAPCSGFRSLITMFSLGIVYVYINKGSFAKKAILTLTIIPLALLGNLLRVVSMCMVTHQFGEAAGTQYHDYSGYAIFVIIILGLIGMEAYLDKLAQKK
jgi:exosortase